MSRWSHYDTDEERLPEGMTRVGYDADTQVYTYRDADGSYWEGAPGSQYGRLTKVSNADGQPVESDDEHDEERAEELRRWEQTSWRTEMMPLLNFLLLVGLFLLAVFWFVTRK